MRNEYNPKIRTIFASAKKLPYFSFDDLASLETNKTYLKILFSRYEKSGKVIRLKRGIYVAKDYLDSLEKTKEFSFYLEFLAGLLYAPAYLSLDYILYQHNILTEVPVNFTAITRNKTASFVNNLGSFFYHKIKDKLFCGFDLVNEGNFTILKATKAKALFDYLYLRKNDLIARKAIEELRLNLEEIKNKDKKELAGYIRQEGSKKMKTIYHYLFD